MNATEKQRLKAWLRRMGRPDLCSFLGLRLLLAGSPALLQNIVQIRHQHRDHDLENWLGRARARTICQRFPHVTSKFWDWAIVGVTLFLVLFALMTFIPST